MINMTKIRKIAYVVGRYYDKSYKPEPIESYIANPSDKKLDEYEYCKSLRNTAFIYGANRYHLSMIVPIFKIDNEVDFFFMTYRYFYHIRYDLKRDKCLNLSANLR